MVQYAIELYFDQNTEKALQELCDKVGELSTGFLLWKSRPHLTLACFSDVDENLCKTRLIEFANSQKVVPVSLDSVGMFCDSKVVFASPTMTEGMYGIQRKLHEHMKGFDTKGWEYYLPDMWVPHCTLAMTGKDEEGVFFEVSKLILGSFEKLNGSFESVGLVKITYPVQELYTVRLGGENE